MIFRYKLSASIFSVFMILFLSPSPLHAAQMKVAGLEVLHSYHSVLDISLTIEVEGSESQQKMLLFVQAMGLDGEMYRIPTKIWVSEGSNKVSLMLKRPPRLPHNMSITKLLFIGNPGEDQFVASWNRALSWRWRRDILESVPVKNENTSLFDASIEVAANEAWPGFNQFLSAAGKGGLDREDIGISYQARGDDELNSAFFSEDLSLDDVKEMIALLRREHIPLAKIGIFRKEVKRIGDIRVGFRGETAGKLVDESVLNELLDARDIETIYQIVGYQKPHKMERELVQVSGINLVESYYSTKSYVAQFEYDGSMGQSIYSGAKAITDRKTQGSSFAPFGISKGKQQRRFLLSRPEVVGGAFEGSEIEFSFYNRQSSIDQIYDISQEWESFDSYFNVTNESLVGAEAMSGVLVFQVNEALSRSKRLISNLAGLGFSENNFDINYNNFGFVDATRVVLKVGEDIKLSAIKTVIHQINNLNLHLSGIEFIGLGDQSFQVGYVGIQTTARGKFNPIDGKKYSLLMASKNIEELYGLTGFKPTSGSTFNQGLLEKAIRLNDGVGSSNGGLKAKRIIEQLLSRDPDNIRAYVELARTYFHSEDTTKDAVAKAIPTLQLALSLAPNNPRVHNALAFNEARRGNFEKAEQHIKIAAEFEVDLNIWRIVNWARIYDWQDMHEKALDKYQTLLDYKNLDPHNARAHRIGLNAYENLLNRVRREGLSEVYEAQISLYPQKNRCKKVRYARHLIRTEGNLEQARALIRESVTQRCKEASEVASIFDVVDWYLKDGSKSELISLMARHGGSADLLYSLSQVAEADAIIQKIVNFGINIDQPDGRGFSALQMATLSGDKESVDLFIDVGASVNFVGNEGWTALMISSFRGDLELSKLLLDNDAKAELKNENDLTALDLARYQKHDNIVELLEGRSI